MKTLLKIALYFCCIFIVNSTMGQEKKDSLFFIVDKDADYIHFTKGPGAKDFKIIVDCDYSSNEWEHGEYIAVGFHYFEYGGNNYLENHEMQKVFVEQYMTEANKVNVAKYYLYKLPKKDLEKYKVVDTEWVHKQKTERDAYKKLPVDWDDLRYFVFVIFKEDLLSCEDTIQAYGVACLSGTGQYQVVPDIKEINESETMQKRE